jgi:hypothetical protein
MAWTAIDAAENLPLNERLRQRAVRASSST